MVILSLSLMPIILKNITSVGKRVKRGLYRTQHNLLVNADCNGAANILRKSNQRVLGRLASGLLANPLRVKIS